MKRRGSRADLTTAILLILSTVPGCNWSARRPAAEWTKARKVAGKRQRLSHISGLAVDDANVYFFDEDGLTADLLCKVPKQGGEVTRLDSGHASGVIAQDKAAVYFASPDDIYSFAK